VQPVLTAAQMAQLDAFTIGTLGLDGRILMSNAARAVLDAICRRWPETRRILVLSGLGNNGGDGLALAYYAHQRGIDTHVAICSPDPFVAGQLSADCGYFYEVCKNAFVPVEPLQNPILLPELISRSAADVVVDALFGTGIRLTLGDFHQELIKRLNMTRRPIVSIDMPSGLCCDKGVELGAAVEATLTVTFGCVKRGLFHPGALNYSGEIELTEIGLTSPSEAGIFASCSHAPDLLWEPVTTPRNADTHKGDYGKLLIVAGHERYPGAPRMAADAALRMGAGLVRLMVPQSIYTASCSNPAVMVAPHTEDGTGGFCSKPDEELLQYLSWADALVIGPGLGDGDATELVAALLGVRDLPTVIDADALRAVLNLDTARNWPLVLTPHIGELARLVEKDVDEVREGWFDEVLAFAEKTSAFLLAKANQSALASPDGDLFFPRRGHPALAVGGSGDVLAGMIGALLARMHAQHFGMASALQRRLTYVETVLTAVNVHSHAAELLAEKLGDDGVTPLDLIDALPLAVRSLAGRAL
jgi:NAD(P)H-hydrate epimerase